MSEGIDCDSGCEIEVSTIFHIPEIDAFPFDEHGWWADVGLYHVGCLFVDEGCGGRVGGWVGVGEAGFTLQIEILVDVQSRSWRSYVDSTPDLLWEARGCGCCL